MGIGLDGGIGDGSEEIKDSTFRDSLVSESRSYTVSSYDMLRGNEFVKFEGSVLEASLGTFGRVRIIS